jgi:hypothetical protein
MWNHTLWSMGGGILVRAFADHVRPSPLAKDGWIERQLGFWIACQLERAAALFGGSQAQTADEPC